MKLKVEQVSFKNPDVSYWRIEREGAFCTHDTWNEALTCIRNGQLCIYSPKSLLPPWQCSCDDPNCPAWKRD